MPTPDIPSPASQPAPDETPLVVEQHTPHTALYWGVGIGCCVLLAGAAFLIFRGPGAYHTTSPLPQPLPLATSTPAQSGPDAGTATEPPQATPVGIDNDLLDGTSTARTSPLEGTFLAPEAGASAPIQGPAPTSPTPVNPNGTTTPEIASSTPIESMSTTACTESDNGNDPYTYGQATGASRQVVTDQDGTQRYADGPVGTYRDACVAAGGTTSYAGKTVYRQLNEYYCGTDARVTVRATVCPYGCDQGACLARPPSPTVKLYADGEDTAVHKAYGSTVTLSWISHDTVSCDIASNGAAAALWNETKVPLTGTKKLTVNDTASSATFTMTCVASTGQTASDSVTVYSQEAP